MVITGDLTQVDLPAGMRSGLADALDTLEGVQGISVVRLNNRDVVRHPLVGRIVDAMTPAGGGGEGLRGGRAGARAGRD